jgi:hypothetical protein
MKTLLHGDPDEAALIKGSARQVLADVLPHDRS